MDVESDKDTDKFTAIDVHIDARIATISLNRPETRNAFDEVMIRELTMAFNNLPDSCHIVVLRGAGKSFSAGADLNWMKKSVEFTPKENRIDARKMVKMFDAINNSPRFVIGAVHGATMAGAMGLIACCDTVIACEGSLFGFTEVRLGLVPAVIAPYVLAKVPMTHLRRYLISGETFGAGTAKHIGLVHEIAPKEFLDSRVADYIHRLKSCGPNAMKAGKQLLKNLQPPIDEEIVDYTVDLIAELRTSQEGQEGLTAFLEKRKPQWLK